MPKVIKPDFDTDKDAVIDRLKEALRQVENDEIEPNRMILLLVDHDVGDFSMKEFSVGRRVEAIGFIELLKSQYIQDTRE